MATSRGLDLKEKKMFIMLLAACGDSEMIEYTGPVGHDLESDDSVRDTGDSAEQVDDTDIAEPCTEDSFTATLISASYVEVREGDSKLIVQLELCAPERYGEIELAIFSVGVDDEVVDSFDDMDVLGDEAESLYRGSATHSSYGPWVWSYRSSYTPIIFIGGMPQSVTLEAEMNAMAGEGQICLFQITAWTSLSTDTTTVNEHYYSADGPSGPCVDVIANGGLD